MNRGEPESFPSDILSQEMQDEIFNNISDMPVNAMADIFEENTTNLINGENDYRDENEYKVQMVYTHMSLPEPEQFLLPIPTQKIMSTDEYQGPFEFDVSICPNGSKNPWVFSPTLNKVFMDMNSAFPVDFKIKNQPQNLLYIRVTPVYSLPQYSQEPVHRCINHEHQLEKSNRGVKENVRQHIIRCSNPSAKYIGDKHQNEHLSVILPLAVPQTGADSVREIFQFVCKNSCPTPGMNRRHVAVIFTLEDHNSCTLGRQTLNVRICSCPKRDKEKEEKESNNSAPLPRGKKRKHDKSEKRIITNNDADNKEYTLTLKIVGKHNVQQILKFSHDLMAGEIITHNDNEIYKNCLNGINNLKNKPLE